MDVKRTEVAEQAASLSEVFNVSVALVRVQGTCEFTPELKVPEGLSTAGGRLARQHITLNPAVTSESSITVGWLDVARKQSLVRTYERLRQIHEERGTGQPFPLDGPSFQTFFDQLHRFLDRTQLSPSIEHPMEKSTLAPRSVPKDGRKPMFALLLVLAVCIILAVAAAAFWFVVRGSSPPGP
jgi:hypothetical protein